MISPKKWTEEHDKRQYKLAGPTQGIHVMSCSGPRSLETSRIVCVGPGQTTVWFWKSPRHRISMILSRSPSVSHFTFGHPDRGSPCRLGLTKTARSPGPPSNLPVPEVFQSQPQFNLFIYQFIWSSTLINHGSARCQSISGW